MKPQLSIHRISYSVYDEVIRPLPQFYFYAWATNDHEALEKLDSYADERSINYRSVAVGYTLTTEELPETIELDALDNGVAIQRDPAVPTHQLAVA